MGTLIEELIVRYKAETSDLKTGLKEAKQEVSSLSGAAKESTGAIKGLFGGMLSMAASIGVTNLAGDAFGFLKDQIKSVFEESLSAQEGMAQTVQVLKSTHDASGMTAQAIADLAGNLSHVTRFSDDVTQSAENMLLTFTNIGKDVFPQATKTVLDMSQALGQDAKSSAIQLGKALNDPITGITALQRVGVTFDDSQKKLIKTYMDHGQVAKAQAVILKELQREFGGSAEAAGKTFPGQLDILKQHLADVEQNIGDALMPLITQFTGYISTSVLPAVGKLSDWFIKYGVPVIQKFSAIVGKDASEAVQGLGSFIADDLVPPAKQIFDVAGQIIENFVRWNDKSHFLQNTMRDVGDLLKRVGDDVATKLMPPIRDLINNFQTWLSKSGTVKDALGLLGTAVDGLSGFVGGLITALSNVFGWFGQNKQQADLLKGAIFAIGGVMAGIKLVEFGKSVFSTFQKAGQDVKGFIDTVGKISDKLGSVLDFFKNKFSPGASKALDDVSTSAEKTATAEEGIGTSATTAETKVGAASALEEAEINTVGGDALVTAEEVGGIGTSANAASAVSKTALGGMAGVLGGIAGGVLAVVALAAGEFFLAKWIKDTFHTEQYVSPQPDWVTHKNLGHADGLTNNPMGHMAWVGERGPERMWIPGGASIYSAEKSMRMGNESYPVRSRSSSVAPYSSSSSSASTGGGYEKEITIIVEMDMVQVARANARTTDRLVRLKLAGNGRAA